MQVSSLHVCLSHPGPLVTASAVPCAPLVTGMTIRGSCTCEHLLLQSPRTAPAVCRPAANKPCRIQLSAWHFASSPPPSRNPLPYLWRVELGCQRLGDTECVRLCAFNFIFLPSVPHFSCAMDFFFPCLPSTWIATQRLCLEL